MLLTITASMLSRVTHFNFLTSFVKSFPLATICASNVLLLFLHPFPVPLVVVIQGKYGQFCGHL